MTSPSFRPDWDKRVWVVTTLDFDGTIIDQEILDEAPTWGPEDLPPGYMQLVREGYVNGGDTVFVRQI